MKTTLVEKQLEHSYYPIIICYQGNYYSDIMKNESTAL